MTEQLLGVLAFAVLFAAFAGYGLLRPRSSCGSGCGSCAASESCSARERNGEHEQ